MPAAILEQMSGGGDAIADVFVRRILEGRHAPGSRLTEREIADVSGCTHARARETLHHLEKAGAVRIFRHRGAVVIGPEETPPGDVARVWTTLLRLLEQDAGASLAALPTPRDPATAHGETVAALEALGEKAGNPRLVELLKRIALQRAILSVEVR